MNSPGELFAKEQIHHDSIAAKLEPLVTGSRFENFKRCGNEFIFRTCQSCGSYEKLPYRCSMKWCPNCNWMITRKRRHLLTAFAKQISQPKHVVLTQRNFEVLSSTKIREFKKGLSRIRRNELFDEVRGGSYSLEITNEGRGWHLHAHLLVEAKWIDASKLAVQWGEQLGQEFGIVKVKDTRDTDYVVEVTKYVAKGSDVAKWSGEEIFQFVEAVSGVRMFGVFGRLFKYRKQILKASEQPKPEPKACECGCCDFNYRDERSELLKDLRTKRK